MTKIAVCGAAGRMGRRLIALAHESDDLSLVGAVEQHGNPTIGADAGELAGVGKLGVTVSDDLNYALEGADVVLAFVNDPAAAIEQAKACVLTNTAFVLGSTGLSAEEQSGFEAAVGPVACVQAANFSVGINLLLGLVEEATRIAGDQYDVEIIEAHHNQKKDSPSGTALALGHAAAAGLGWKLSEVAKHGREGLEGSRPENQIAFHAIRAGDIVGTHTVLLGGAGETVELTHRAQSRDTFASGALRAAGWVVGKPPGLYGMKEVLGL